MSDPNRPRRSNDGQPPDAWGAAAGGSSEGESPKIARSGRHFSSTHAPTPGSSSSTDRRGSRVAPVRFRPGRRRRWPRRILISVNMLAAVSVIGIASAYGYINVQLGRIKTAHISALAKKGSGKPFTMLIVGSDTRALADGKAFGASSAPAGQRSDTIMLARVVPSERQITLMSVPRDLYVPVQGMGQTRINSAFNAGPNLLVQTIENDLGIPINHYVEVNFDSFRQVTDAIGGVRFWVPTAVRDPLAGLFIHQAGCIPLTGDQALAFVRSRHYEYYHNGEFRPEAASDLARIQRQQAFVKRMVDKAQGQFTNPLALNSIVSGVTKNLTVDSNFSTSLILSLARTFRGISSTGIPTATLPTMPQTINGADVLTLAQPEAQTNIAAFNQLGTPAAPSSTTSAAPTSSSTSAPAAAPSPSSVSVEVVNGSGVNGQAGQATAALTGAGYKATTNASSRAYGGAASQIRYAPDALASAQLLASKLAGGATLAADPALSSTSYNLELITGTGYSGLAKAGAATTAPSAAAQTTTTAPPARGTSSSTYVLPGTPPGQLPPADCTP
ncbi:MAG: LCP family protein [Actinomycetota bacterium]|nr:LCP family protein [Actinomycetota bacterium]